MNSFTYLASLQIFWVALSALMLIAGMFISYRQGVRNGYAQRATEVWLREEAERLQAAQLYQASRGVLYHYDPSTPLPEDWNHP